MRADQDSQDDKESAGEGNKKRKGLHMTVVAKADDCPAKNAIRNRPLISLVGPAGLEPATR
jgi:hypothetical protein